MSNSNNWLVSSHLKAYAKINWDLLILGRRFDGYHEIDSLVTQISIYDEVLVSISNGSNIEIDCEIAPREENLCYKAVKIFFEKMGRNFNVKIGITKNIPYGAGLGGGSSDAASTIFALDNLLKTNFSQQDLFDIALQVGSDVPSFLLNGWRRIKGRGEQVEQINGPTLKLILLKPDSNLNTAEVYKKFDDLPYKKQVVPKVIERFQTPTNDLQKVAENLTPEIRVLLDQLLEYGAKNVSMTGSGSCVFGVFENDEEANKTILKIDATYKKIVSTCS